MKKPLGPQLPSRPPQRKPSKPANSESDGRASARLQEVAAGSSSAHASGAGQLQSAREAFPDLASAMSALSSGQRPELLEQMSAAMQLTPAQLQQTVAVLKDASQGRPVSMSDLPPDLLQRAAAFQSAKGQANGHSHSAMAPPGTGASAPPPDSERGLLDEEEGQHWLVLYREAYFKQADVFLGPAFTASTVVLFWAEVLPFWAALVFLPLLLALAVRYILLKCKFPFSRLQLNVAGFSAWQLPMSRLPAGMTASLEVAAMGTFLVSMLPLLSDMWAQCGLLLAMSSAAYYLHYRAYATDAGALPSSGSPPTAPHHQLASMQAANPYFCLTCNIYKPIRSKHCAVCNRCREELDHHCPVIANCVARGNRRCFAAYLVTLLAAEALWMHLALLFHRRVLQTRILHTGALPPTWAVLRHLFLLGAALPGTTYMTVMVAGIMGGTAFLAGRQLLCIAANLTTNEWILRQRYDYLKGEDGLFWNPFDAGPVANCATFWGEARPDWYAIYAQRKDLDPATAAPAWSLGRVLRRADQVGAALADARAQRAKEREAWLLRKYAGGAGEAADALEAQPGQCQGCQNHAHH